MDKYRFTILGCGSSGGVPRIGDIWGQCDPQNPKNRRLRCSLLVERVSGTGTTRVLIDTSPDMREQLIKTKIDHLDAVVYTHAHADHMHGLDDLRQLVFLSRKRLNVWADMPTQTDLYSRFGYAFVQPEGSAYPPICDMKIIEGPITVDGAGGPITLTPLKVKHGRIDALGFRVANFAYLPDVSEIYDETWSLLEGLDMWVLDALRRDPHPTHAHLDLALQWIDHMAPKEAILTNMHIDLDHDDVARETPDHVSPAYDGRVIEMPV
ncbi:MAG: MBL fold metallo-hydrolase [Halocynthiibacter sp.]